MKRIEYCWRSHTDAERRRDTVQKELFSIGWPAHSLCSYLKNIIFTIRVDQEYLKWILNLTGSIGRIAHWRRRLFKYELDVAHRARIELKTTDVLSCSQTTEIDRMILKNDLSLLANDVIGNEEQTRFNDAKRKKNHLDADPTPAINTPPCKEKIIVKETSDKHRKVVVTQVDHASSWIAVNERTLNI